MTKFSTILFRRWERKREGRRCEWGWRLVVATPPAAASLPPRVNTFDETSRHPRALPSLPSSSLRFWIRPNDKHLGRIIHSIALLNEAAFLLPLIRVKMSSKRMLNVVDDGERFFASRKWYFISLWRHVHRYVDNNLKYVSRLAK